MKLTPQDIAKLSPEERRTLLATLLKEKKREETRIAPLSHGQRSLWLTQQVAPESRAYSIAFAWRIRSAVDSGALQRALQQIIDRHEALRTTYIVQHDVPVQQIHAEQKSAFVVIDAVSWSEVELAARLVDVSQQLFDLERGPVIRPALFTRAQQESILLLVVHHIVMDMWSLSVFLDELGKLYTAETSGVPIRLPAPQRQYTDFVGWQNELLAGPRGAELWAYWRQQLSPADNPELPVLRLSTDRPRPPVQTYAGAIHHFMLDEQIVRSLRELAQAEGATLYATLLAAFYVLLFRYTGQNDLIIGSPTAGRAQSDFANTIGLFANPVALRARLSGHQTFRKLVAQVRQTVLDAIKHQDYPFHLLVEQLLPKRDMSRAPIFDVIFILQRMHLSDRMAAGSLFGAAGQLHAGELALEFYPLEQQAARYDLEFELMEAGPIISGGVIYNTDLFDAATISRLTEHFQILLAAMVDNADRPIAELAMLSDHERQRLLSWNQRHETYPAADCLHTRFETIARQLASAPAVVCSDRHLTYAELDARATELAHRLRKLGVRPEVRVGLCVERSLELVIGILAILKAGGAYVPLDPGNPAERLSFILADAGVSVLLVQRQTQDRLPGYHGPIVCIDAEQAERIAHEPLVDADSATSDSAAYVIYTSGSTGVPKGVVVSHGNVMRLFHATLDWFHFDQHDVWTLFHSYAFDFSVWELWGALLHGGRLIVVPQAVSRNPEAFYQLICAEQVTVLSQTPSFFRQLLGVMSNTGNNHRLNLRSIIFGGEALDLKSLQPWFDRYPEQQTTLVNMYGITETTVHVTYRPISATDLHGPARSPIGQAIPDLQLYILDEQMQPQPVGVAGELFVGGAGLARGYLHRPALTAERFVPDPFNTAPGARLYRTGDVARYLSSGEIEYCGRADQQIKIRGFRIELGEIESRLSQHPAVTAAAAVVLGADSETQQLVAYLATRPEDRPSTSQIRTFLAAYLPDYMIPSTFMFMDSLPLTANGKVDRKALPAPDTARPVLDQRFVPPRSQPEAQLAQIWSQVLGIEAVGIDDNFFDLGGDSFKAVMIVRQLEYTLSVLDIFTHPTIRQLVAYLAQRTTSAQRYLHQLTAPTTAPRMSLVCVPYGGGDAFIYYPLAQKLPEGYTLYAVALPGHDLSRQNEALKPLTEVARGCVAEIKERIVGPITLYGHCAGVALTLEIARLLEAEAIPLQTIYLAGTLLPERHAAQTADTLISLQASSAEAETIKLLQSLGGFEEIVEAEERAFIMRIFEHDRSCAIAYFMQAYEAQPAQKLRTPITCICGTTDPLTRDYQEQFKEWSFFGDTIRLAVIPGGHYFVKHQAAELADLLVALTPLPEAAPELAGASTAL